MRSASLLLLLAPLAIAGPLNTFPLLPRIPSLYGCADDMCWIGSGCAPCGPTDYNPQDPDPRYRCPPGQCIGSAGCTKDGCQPENINDRCPDGQRLGLDGCVTDGAKAGGGAIPKIQPAGSGGCPIGQCQGTDGCTAIGCPNVPAVA